MQLIFNFCSWYRWQMSRLLIPRGLKITIKGDVMFSLKSEGLIIEDIS